MLFHRLLVAFVVAFGASCSYGGVDVDPRDEAATRTYEKSCDRTTGQVTLVVNNRSTFNVLLTLHTRGAERNLRPTAQGLSVQRYKLSRMDFRQGHYIALQNNGGGMSLHNKSLVELQPLMCDTGTLEIGPSLNLSFFVGSEWRTEYRR